MRISKNEPREHARQKCFENLARYARARARATSRTKHRDRLHPTRYQILARCRKLTHRNPAIPRARHVVNIPSVSIREATLADAAQVAELLGELGYPSSVEIMTERLAAFAAAGEVALLAVDQDRALGVLSLHLTPVLHRPTAVGRITALVVTESMRGHRIGEALVAAAERWLAHRGCALVEVTSNAARTDAHRFYERLGYESTSLRFKKGITSA
jgi:GNAT superfamily N-acetyltransferase